MSHLTLLSVVYSIMYYVFVLISLLENKRCGVECSSLDLKARHVPQLPKKNKCPSTCFFSTLGLM